ncbi:MAG: hypothetical protein ACLSA2_06775 [Candidatus Gastranaerophilaceae bacterium]
MNSSSLWMIRLNYAPKLTLEENQDSFEILLYGQVGEEIINFDEFTKQYSGEKYNRIKSQVCRIPCTEYICTDACI